VYIVDGVEYMVVHVSAGDNISIVVVVAADVDVDDVYDVIDALMNLAVLSLPVLLFMLLWRI